MIDLRLACLAAEGEPGGIGGLRSLMRLLARSSAPVVLTPGVVHLPSVPAHRKVNRVDMGTADKVCAAALAMREQAERRGCRPADVSLVLLELGGAFTAAIAVDGGRIVDGIGGYVGSARACAPRARSTAKSRFSPAPCPRACCSSGGVADDRRQARRPAEALGAPPPNGAGSRGMRTSRAR